MSATFELQITEDLPDLQRLIQQLTPAKLTAAMKVIGVRGEGLAAQTFKESKNPYGEKWAALQESTLNAFIGRAALGRRPRRKERGTKPLIRTADLMGSINSQLVMDGSAVVIGVSAAYGKYHQGDPDHASKDIVPERSFLPKASRGLPEAWNDMVVDSIERHLEGGS